MAERPSQLAIALYEAARQVVETRRARQAAEAEERRARLAVVKPERGEAA